VRPPDFDVRAIRALCRATGLTDDRFGLILGITEKRVKALKHELKDQQHDAFPSWGERWVLELIRQRCEQRGVNARLFFEQLATRVKAVGYPVGVGILHRGEEP